MQTTWTRPKSIKNLGLALYTVGVMVILRLALPRLPLLDLLQRLKPSQTPSYPNRPRFEKAAQYIEVLLRRYPFPLSGQCLPRALMRYYFATRYGLGVRFYCGVCHDGDRLEGHAWVNVNGQPFQEAIDPETIYTITFSFPKRPDRVTVVRTTDPHAVE
jgi:hypothetical protein